MGQLQGHGSGHRVRHNIRASADGHLRKLLVPTGLGLVQGPPCGT